MMLRLVPIVLATVALVVFALSNAQQVALHFVLGQTELPLIFLLVASFAGGAITVFLFSVVSEAERRALEKKMRIRMNRAALSHVEVE
jgi:uncharacterized integral membrane protein